MTKKQWEEKHGLKAFFRNGKVILYKPNLNNLAYWRYNHNGAWMDNTYDNIQSWGTMQIGGDAFADIFASYRLCYCSSLADSTCDFCGQTRSALRYLWSVTEQPGWATAAQIDERISQMNIQ